MAFDRVLNFSIHFSKGIIMATFVNIPLIPLSILLHCP